jgi:PAS domain-containing protein
MIYQDWSVVGMALATYIAGRKQDIKLLTLLASVFTHAREGIMITAADGAILKINEAFARVTGYRREEVLREGDTLARIGVLFLSQHFQCTSSSRLHDERAPRCRKFSCSQFSAHALPSLRSAPMNAASVLALLSALSALMKSCESIACI